MPSKQLVLIRGLPSAGKTTLAKCLSGLLGWNYHRFETDSYFINADDVYVFDGSQLGKAHQWCQNSAALAIGTDQNVVVSNTFTCRWEMEPYLAMAKDAGFTVTVIDLFDGGCTDEVLHQRNQHGVPLEAFASMRQRYEHDWGNGDPLPPWERIKQTAQA